MEETQRKADDDDDDDDAINENEQVRDELAKMKARLKQAQPASTWGMCTQNTDKTETDKWIPLAKGDFLLANYWL